MLGVLSLFFDDCRIRSRQQPSGSIDTGNILNMNMEGFLFYVNKLECFRLLLFVYSTRQNIVEMKTKTKS